MDVTQGTATQDGVVFGPNGTGKLYISLFYHRDLTRAHKSAWCRAVPPPMEYGIFCDADTHLWRDQQDHYWAVHAGGTTVLGARGERLSKFPCPSNVMDPWHGFPVSPLERGDDDAPADDFVDAWIAAGVVSKPVGRRIQRRKI